MPAYKLWEIMERAETGPFIEDEDFNYKVVVPKIKEVVEKYEIKYDPDQPVPADDDMADRIWQAAVEFFLEVGALNINTHRRMIVDESELREALYHTPGRLVVGDGKDARVWENRHVEDKRTPFCIFSGDITVDEDAFLSHSMAYINEPLADGVCGPILEDTVGLKIKSGSPTEQLGVVQHAMTLRQAAKLAGRPDMFLVAVGTAQSDTGQVAVSNNEWGVRYTDGRLIGVLSEFKVDSEVLNKIVHCMHHGCSIGTLSGTIYGGYSGGSEGTAVMETSYHLLGRMIYQCDWQLSFPFHLLHTSNTSREMLWLVSMKHQALARNSKLLTLSSCFSNAGPGVEMVFREAAAHGIASTVSGGHLWEIGPARNKYRNYATPLEARLACEAGHAVALQGMSRAEANEIVLKLIATYEDRIEDADKGKSYQECYDVKTARPQPWYIDMYKKVKEEVAELGVEFPY